MPRSATSRPHHPRANHGALASSSAANDGPLELRTLFESHYTSIWRLLRRLGVAEAELDVAQEVFWVAARRLGDIEPPSAHAFLYGVALRIAKNHHRKQPAAPQLSVDAAAELADDMPSPEEELQHLQARRLLDEVLNQMPLELRTVLVLYELEELEVRQIAELEAIPVGTASSRLRRAREAFAAITKRLRATLRSKGMP